MPASDVADTESSEATSGQHSGDEQDGRKPHYNSIIDRIPCIFLPSYQIRNLPVRYLPGPGDSCPTAHSRWYERH